MTATPLHDAIRRGSEAQDLLADPAFSLAVSDIAQAIVEQWAASDLPERDRREDLYRQYTALTLVAQQLATRAAAGKVAQERLREDHELAILEGEEYTIPRGMSSAWEDPNDWDLD